MLIEDRKYIIKTNKYIILSMFNKRKTILPQTSNNKEHDAQRSKVIVIHELIKFGNLLLMQIRKI